MDISTTNLIILTLIMLALSSLGLREVYRGLTKGKIISGIGVGFHNEYCYKEDKLGFIIAFLFTSVITGLGCYACLIFLAELFG